MILALFIITVTMNNAQIINVFTYQDPYLIYNNSDLMSAIYKIGYLSNGYL